MELHNALMPDAEQIQYLLTSTDPGPVTMINLLKFKPKAVYADGRETDLSGFEAFMVYSNLMRDLVGSYGGRFLVSAILDRLVMGRGDLQWDRIGIVEYPSRAVFLKVFNDPRVKEAAVHRHAGLEGQLLIASTLQTNDL